MKLAVISTLLLSLTVVAAQEKYVTKIKNIDLDSILRNERLLASYYKCLLEGIGCTPDGEELRNILPDAIKSGCVKCTDEQKAGAKKITTYLIKNKPDWWKVMVNKYDPDSIYRTKHKDLLRAEGYDV